MSKEFYYHRNWIDPQNVNIINNSRNLVQDVMKVNLKLLEVP